MSHQERPSSKGGSDPFPEDASSDEGNVPSLKDGIALFPKDASMEEGNVPYSKDVSPEEGEWKPVVKRGGLRREGGWRLPISDSSLLLLMISRRFANPRPNGKGKMAWPG